jgi:hypothetical protein
MPRGSTESPVQCVPNVKWPGCEADDSPVCFIVVPTNSGTLLIYILKPVEIMFERCVSKPRNCCISFTNTTSRGLFRVYLSFILKTNRLVTECKNRRSTRVFTTFLSFSGFRTPFAMCF